MEKSLNQYLKTRVFTGETDNILTIGVRPQDLKGKVTAADSVDAAKGSFNLIICLNQLSGSYDTRDFFSKARELLAPDGILIMAEPVVGEEDAWLNTLVAIADKSHVRSMRAEELISTAAEHFQLMEYTRTKEIFTYPLSEESFSLCKNQLEEFPEAYIDAFLPSLGKGELALNRYVGFFTWQ